MRFSIITITRNNLIGLQVTADSLHVQTCRDFEWIVIDGDSSDGTKNYLRTLPAQTISEPDTGIYEAMNKGIDRANGDYLLFLNAGDTLAQPDTLAKIADQSAGQDFIFGDALENGEYKSARPYPKILYGMITHHQAMFYRRTALGNLRYDTRYKIAADYKFTVLFARQSQSALHCPFPVCIFEPGGLSQTQTRQGRIEQFLIRKELKTCKPMQNSGIYMAQAALMALRRISPKLYWKIRHLRV
ncbi:MAG: glycosyltransferase family 2 protein [Micavibrio sp.]